MDLTALLGRGLSDHLALAERVITQVVDRLAEDEVFGAGDESPAERIAMALGNRLSRLVRDEESSSARYEELVERNIALASALGACDCWGENTDCPICDGEGRAGWLPPDPHLFATYVQPVARNMAQPETHRPNTHNNQPINHKENNHD
jgi:hypothetical protein